VPGASASLAPPLLQRCVRSVSESNVFGLQGLRKALVMTRTLAYGLFSVHRIDTHVKARGILPYELDWFVLRPTKSLNQTPSLT
jgi:hypothetical protein